MSIKDVKPEHVLLDPPITAIHAIITDDCRRNRGDAGALEEALRRIQGELQMLLQVHAQESGVQFHVKLEVQQPKEEL